tara:strand:+ start:654 stop:779 length:126 start_codon:yes stop_codon:yes gene_type:complete
MNEEKAKNESGGISGAGKLHLSFQSLTEIQGKEPRCWIRKV